MKRIKIITLLFSQLASLIFSCCENSVKDGEIKSYFEDGTLKRVINYKGGLKYGDERIYYPSGNLKMERQWVNDTLVYQQSEYYDSLTSYLGTNPIGDTMIWEHSQYKSYSFVNENGEISYKVNYDMNAEATDYFGEPIVSVFSDTIHDKTGVKYKVIYGLATPPFMENREFKISVSKEKETIDSAILEIDREYNIATYLFEPKDPGDYVFRAIYNQQGEKNASSDTSYAKLEVK